jgi:hypothetical protein
MLMCRKPKPADYVFPNAEGKPYRPKSAERVRTDLRAVNQARAERGENPVIADAAIDPIEFKSPRRTFSSLLKNQDVDKEDRGKLMGHSGETVTERNYTLHELDRLAGLVARIPLTWPSVDTAVATEASAPQTPSASTEDSPAIPGRSTEARIGFEPTYDGFANRCLTTWLPRRSKETSTETWSRRQPRVAKNTTVFEVFRCFMRFQG